MTRLIVGTMDTEGVASSSVSTNERHKVTLKVTVPEDIIPASKVLAGIVTYNAEVNCISLKSINNFERGSEGSSGYTQGFMTKAKRSEMDARHRIRRAGRIYENGDRLGVEVCEIP